MEQPQSDGAGRDPLVIFTPSGRRGRVPAGTPVLTAARQLGVDLDSVCGGRGICSKCQVAPAFGAGLSLGKMFNVAEMVPPSDIHDLDDGEEVKFAGLAFEVIHAPGHSPGCVMLRARDGGDEIVFSGDVLFAGSIGRTDLPGADPQASLSNQLALSVSTHLDATYTRRLLHDAPSAYRTQINDLLLTALARVITRWSGEASTLIRLEGHGREDLFDDIDLTRTVGWFTSLYPVQLVPADSLAASLKRIKEQLRAVPDKGLGFGALRYLGNAATQQALAALPQNLSLYSR